MTIFHTLDVLEVVHVLVACVYIGISTHRRLLYWSRSTTGRSSTTQWLSNYGLVIFYTHIVGGTRGGAQAPSLFLGQTQARRAKKNDFESQSLFFLRLCMRAPPTPYPPGAHQLEDLNLPLHWMLVASPSFSSGEYTWNNLVELSGSIALFLRIEASSLSQLIPRVFSFSTPYSKTRRTWGQGCTLSRFPRRR